MIVTGEGGKTDVRNVLGPLFRLAVPVGVAVSLALTGNANAASLASGLVSLQITTQLGGISATLTAIATALAVALFILAGIFYAIGQIMPPDKKATYHTTCVNILIGAVVLSALSFAATGLANTSAHLLVNATNSLTSNS